MTITGPETYSLNLADDWYQVRSQHGEPHFVYPATSRKPKLYLIFKNSELIYVGVCITPMASRIGMGMRARGKNGYHGYAWKSLKGQMRLDVWYLEAETGADLLRELESIEAEVVHFFRTSSGQWPSHQTEIHFHESNSFHRNAARRILQSAAAT